MLHLAKDTLGTSELVRRSVVYPDRSTLLGRDGASRILEDYPFRFTALLRLAPGARLAQDDMRPGLEILVVEGQVEVDGVPLGRHSYVRHPSSPTPSVTATVETVLFVKRGHIPADDRVQTVTAPHLELWQVRQEDGLLVLPLHRHGGLTVSLTRYRPGAAAIVDRPPGGTETLVLEGTMLDERSAYPSGSWIRNPPGSLHQPYSVEGCLLYCQTGHLPIL